jgi:hypothetical protein
LSTGAAGEEESEAAGDCGGAVTGPESDAELDDIAGVKVGKVSGSATTTAFFISGISLALFVTSLFSWMGLLFSLFLLSASFPSFLSAAGC